MRAVVIEGPGQITVQTVPDPEPGSGDVIVRVGACGLCGSDLRIVAYTAAAGSDAADRLALLNVVGTQAMNEDATRQQR